MWDNGTAEQIPLDIRTGHLGKSHLTRESLLLRHTFHQGRRLRPSPSGKLSVRILEGMSRWVCLGWRWRPWWRGLTWPSRPPTRRRWPSQRNTRTCDSVSPGKHKSCSNRVSPHLESTDVAAAAAGDGAHKEELDDAGEDVEIRAQAEDISGHGVWQGGR